MTFMRQSALIVNGRIIRGPTLLWYTKMQLFYHLLLWDFFLQILIITLGYFPKNYHALKT